MAVREHDWEVNGEAEWICLTCEWIGEDPDDAGVECPGPSDTTEAN